MKKKLLSVLAAAALGCSLFSAVPVISQAKEYTSGDYTYSTEYDLVDYYHPLDNECIITGYTGSDDNIIIPSELDGKTVTGIGEEAFAGNEDITAVAIPDTVKYIGTLAFSGCTRLADLDLGNGVEFLDDWCFQICESLTSIEIPASLTSEDAVASESFALCDSLKTVTIASGGVKIPERIFFGCDALESVIIPEGIKKIEFGAFNRCSSLKEIKIPDSVQTIGAGAFYRCTSLESFYDYNENTEYNSYIFDECPSLTIHGYAGSNAEKYAKENNITFVSLSGEEPDDPKDPEDPDDPVVERAMYRLYNPNSGEHFYTSNSTEKDNLVLFGWKSEGEAWIAPTSSNTPVYRVYNPNSGEHHYTMKSAEKDFLVSIGWNDEGIGWYSDDNQGTPLYRLYNPNATGQYEAGGHHYTKDVEERDYLIATGWNDEGIGWYGK